MDSLKVCEAKSKQSGRRCGNYAVKGKRVCHIHGGKSMGAKTVRGRQAQKLSNWKHGYRSSGRREQEQNLKVMIKECKDTLGRC